LKPRILAVNPGSTSTKAAIFEGETLAAELEVQHDKKELARFPRVLDQKDLRKKAIESAFHGNPAWEAGFDAVAGRGGLLAPMPGGVYPVNERMLDDLRAARFGEHPCNLGAFLAVEFAAGSGCPAFIVDPPVTDEMDPVARITGLPEITRRSVFHALSQRGAARKAARKLGVAYEEENFIVAHLGGGVTIGAHRRGRVVDVINGVDGEGPFTPERAGGVPLVPVLRLLENGACDAASMRGKVMTHAGLFAHLGVNDLRIVERRIEEGDANAAAVYDAMVYNVVKGACSMAPILFRGPQEERGLRAIVLTGGMARSERLVRDIAGQISFLAESVAITGLEELESLAEGVRLALAGLIVLSRYVSEK